MYVSLTTYFYIFSRILSCNLQGSRISKPYGHIIFDNYMSRKMITSGYCEVLLTASTSPIRIFHQDQRRLPINRFSVRIKYDIGLEPNLEYILGLLNVNGNITHSNQTHDYLVQPWAYITFKFKSRGHYYDSMISKVLLKYSLQKRCNIVSIIENYRIYHLSRQATWEPLATSRSLISKGLYQPPMTNLNSITYLLNYFTLRY